jgi:hypothetical protein
MILIAFDAIKYVEMRALLRIRKGDNRGNA